MSNNKTKTAEQAFGLKGTRKKSLQPIEGKGYYISINGDDVWVDVYQSQSTPTQKIQKRSKTRMTSDFDLVGAWKKRK